MIARKAVASLLLFVLLLSPSICALGQSQTTGRIVGIAKDQNGAVIVGAEITVTSRATAEERSVTTDPEGNYIVPLLNPGIYRARITANGFNAALFESVQVVITETTTVNA